MSEAAATPNESTITQGQNLLNAKLDSENAALNLLVGFIGVAQRRGAFAINESAKIYQALQMFSKAPQEEKH